MKRPFRFGVLIETRDIGRRDLLELAARAEDEGYAVVLGTDHLGRLASLPLLQAAAEATTLRIGTLVLNNDFRHPAILAQELATLDRLTDGRLEIGLGAGWDRPEYEAAGMPFDRPGRRIARLQGTVGVLKQSLGEGRIEREADGAYPAMRLENMPRSLQRPHPPLLIGGGGRRMLSYAAQVAQIVGLDPRALPEGGHDPGDVTEAAVEQKVGWVREAAGERWSELELNIIVRGLYPDYRRRSGRASENKYGLSADELARSPFFLAGDATEMTDALLARRERFGINYLTLRPEQMGAVSPVVSKLAGA